MTSFTPLSKLPNFNPRQVPVTGVDAHLPAVPPDRLTATALRQRFVAPRVATRHTHGTGCTLSAALAALRPQRAGWAEAVGEAKAWLSAALDAADRLEVGHGIGPVHHFHEWW